MSYYIAFKATIENHLFNGLMKENYKNLYKKENLHCTLFYSSGDYNKNAEVLKASDLESKIIDVVLWEDKGEKFIVLKLETDKLSQINKKIVSFLGDVGIEKRVYVPHITIKKGPDCIHPGEFKFLIGSKVVLHDFYVREKLK